LGIKNLKEEIFNKFQTETNFDLEKDNDEQNIKVSILGKPNAGKSTFFNSIIKENRSIVSTKAGTTRDAIS
jgi:GTP-binding protein